MTMTLQPGQVPTDEELEQEAAALEEELQGKYDLAKKDDFSLSILQQMTNDELAKLAKKEKVPDFATLSKQKLVFEILRSRARKQGLMIGEGTLELLPDGYGFLRSPEYSYVASAAGMAIAVAFDGAKAKAVASITSRIESLNRESRKLSSTRARVEAHDSQQAGLLRGARAEAFTRAHWRALTLELQDVNGRTRALEGVRMWIRWLFWQDVVVS